MTQDELISIFCGFLPYLNKFFAAIQKIIGGELFFFNRHYSLLAGPSCIIWRLHHSPIQYVVMIRVELADKIYNLTTLLLLSVLHQSISHRLQPGIKTAD